MDPLLPSNAELMDPEGDKDEKRKIQFSVPSSVPPQLDPRQVEMIRRRRPTPATLFRLTDPPSPEEDSGPHQWVLTDNGILKSKVVSTMTYQPPSLKVVQKMAKAHLACLTSMDKDDSSDEEVDKDNESHQKGLSEDLNKDVQTLQENPTLPDSSTEKYHLNHNHSQEEKEAKAAEEEKGE